jgi:hypothetical protein
MGEIIGVHQCGFRRNRSTTDQIFCIHHILEKGWEYNENMRRRPFQGLEHLRSKTESRIFYLQLYKGQTDFKHRITLCRNNYSIIICGNEAIFKRWAYIFDEQYRVGATELERSSKETKMVKATAEKLIHVR